MFLFVGIIMAVLQGGFVRRIPQGKEKKAAMGLDISFLDNPHRLDFVGVCC